MNIFFTLWYYADVITFGKISFNFLQKWQILKSILTPENDISAETFFFSEESELSKNHYNLFPLLRKSVEFRYFFSKKQNLKWWE